jgi:hypothetical protein
MSFTWLEKVESELNCWGVFYGDFFYLLSSAIVERKTSFTGFLSDASRGVGFNVREGLFYLLDQDWDEPSKFNEVSFFIGDVESSSISVSEFVRALEVAALTYVKEFNDEKDMVLNCLLKLKLRYSAFLN